MRLFHLCTQIYGMQVLQLKQSTCYFFLHVLRQINTLFNFGRNHLKLRNAFLKCLSSNCALIGWLHQAALHDCILIFSALWVELLFQTEQNGFVCFPDLTRLSSSLCSVPSVSFKLTFHGKVFFYKSWLNSHSLAVLFFVCVVLLVLSVSFWLVVLLPCELCVICIEKCKSSRFCPTYNLPLLLPFFFHASVPVCWTILMQFDLCWFFSAVVCCCLQ